ncbi:thiamine/thiamine pyrophosphate ABC transporter permease ThiP [Pasteurella multocida]|uniref:thiamine/thiamine pyrophosphate ABC transporter permease ThiP n=1 Tax=Pasteurella multocida TaxID=747 RepID=UPI0020237FC1|nr:thiamine/thiamine pyrophosphate ABC transporter permease ThiP [Pasteurella multocida]URH78964.1 thiamine/thiamine pyrophosphate ABC transporter permease ThiP [Pasteurella multocida]URH82673.1 thiamine/thiamine pyrophosphate ABC transporter permease ThiP [Pasteurella multocida]HDR0995590.1 thiamine/thiamine pyrophosphate ABC transporter permease ThiP [Pasteurella multocida]HDR1005257.1 thiamine/thiamine pyrophosphate ABC transporter permease ThiP [Pasteurella multocida]HDR1008233.1 thiamine/
MFKRFRAFTYRPASYLGGMLVIVFLIAFYAFALGAVFSLPFARSWTALLSDQYLQHVIIFSFWQAFLSAVLAVLFGVIVARAFFYQPFVGKKLILKLFSLTFVLPALVVIFGLLGVYGASGWLAMLSQFFAWDWTPNIYGLTGILLAHLFFNVPLACRLFLQGLQAIPVQQRQLAAQLNLRGWHFIRLIEWPYLRQQLLPAFTLIFMLCFTSFAIVLTLGGGPKYTTLEVAIYQAILFEFDVPKAGLFALLQFVFCFLLFTLSSFFSPAPATTLHSQPTWFAPQSYWVKLWQRMIIVCATVFILLPLLNTLVSALLSPQFFTLWLQPQLWKALGYSLTIAPTSALLALVLSFTVLLLARELHWRHYRSLSHVILNIGATILAIPTLVLAIGLFILLREIDFSPYHLFGVVVCCNALAAMPFVLRILALPMHNNMIYYEKLCQSLNLRGWQRFRLIEWHKLRAPMKYAFALACALSLGDFTAIALFGQADFTSLPHLLYQQLGHYRSQEAAVTAFILLVFCLSVFMIIERHQEPRDD